jgi:hypothetical protein
MVKNNECTNIFKKNFKLFLKYILDAIYEKIL